MKEITENIGLVKESEDEFYSIDTANANLDKIDEEFGKKVNFPSGGSEGEFLKLGSDGAVKWGPGSETLWVGALFGGGNIEFDVPAYCIRDNHLSLVVELFMVDRGNAKAALVTLFWDGAKKEASDDGCYYPYRNPAGPIAILRRCDVAGDETDDRGMVLEIRGQKIPVQSRDGYIDTYKVQAFHLMWNTSNKELVFTRISAYVPG